jgi:hypothetical protein
MKLLLYPYVIVRVRCSLCVHEKNYRLARLAARFGIELELDELLVKLTHDCPLRHEPMKRSRARSMRRCQACFVDLRDRPPPDLPPASEGLRVIRGGRKDDAA